MSGTRRELIGNGRHFQRTIRYSANGCVEIMMGGIIDLQEVGVALWIIKRGKKNQ